MPDFTVIKCGIDTSGRTIWMTTYAWRVWQALLAQPAFDGFREKIIIVQGAFMTRDGGGAADSAGYHDKAKCWDIRTWNLTAAELDIFIREARKVGIACWRRDLTAAHGGMDEHCHCTFGADQPGSPGADQSWLSYLRGDDGLVGDHPDYEWRPSPLVTAPPASLFKEDYMASDDAKTKLEAIQTSLDKIQAGIDAAATQDQKRWTAERERDAAERDRQTKRYADLVSKIGALADQLTGDARQKVLAVLAAEPDVTGADNPAHKE